MTLFETLVAAERAFQDEDGLDALRRLEEAEATYWKAVDAAKARWEALEISDDARQDCEYNVADMISVERVLDPADRLGYFEALIGSAEI